MHNFRSKGIIRYTLANVSELPVTKNVPFELNAQQKIWYFLWTVLDDGPPFFPDTNMNILHKQCYVSEKSTPKKTNQQPNLEVVRHISLDWNWSAWHPKSYKSHHHMSYMKHKNMSQSKNITSKLLTGDSKHYSLKSMIDAVIQAFISLYFKWYYSKMRT